MIATTGTNDCDYERGHTTPGDCQWSLPSATTTPRGGSNDCDWKDARADQRVLCAVSQPAFMTAKQNKHNFDTIDIGVSAAHVLLAQKTTRRSDLSRQNLPTTLPSAPASQSCCLDKDSASDRSAAAADRSVALP